VLRVVLAVTLFFSAIFAKEPIHWAAYYSDELPPNRFAGFQLLVLDADSHPPLSLLLKNRVLLGYISIGEVEKSRKHFAGVKAEKLLAGQNANWPDSYFVDVRDRRWTSRVKRIIKDVLQQGFHGVFLDTVDDAEYLESKDPKLYQGMKDAMARLILDVRREFPGIPIAVNRGYAILPKICGSMDFLLGESVITTYDFSAKEYRRVPHAQYVEHQKILRSAQQCNSKLTVLTLDYWNPKDAAGIARIYREQIANGFHPYVSTLKLDQIIPEPKQ
jgi:polysaccharide biosynthesis protein PelA